MLTGELKNKIDGIWTTLWTEGSTNPLTNIEQVTYLLFMKGLDEGELAKEADAELLGLSYDSIFPNDKAYLRWNVFKNLGDSADMYNKMVQEIFPFIKGLGGREDSAFSTYMKDAIFQINKPATLQKVVAALDSIPMEDRDTKGDLYEYLLSKLATSGTNGQFRTPRHIINMIVELMKPTPGDIIIDPAMGSAGFLVSASEYLRKNHAELFLHAGLKSHYHNDMFFGNDMDSTMLRIGAMNMMLHGVDSPNIFYKDSLSQDNIEKDKYTLVLANPPFKGSLDYESVSNDLLAIAKTKKTELLFLSLFLRILKPGGRAAVIVPDGVLFGGTKAHKAIRQEIIENNKLEAVISMPSGVFKPYAGVSTAILIFTKTIAGGTDNVWFYDMKADGYSLDDKRNAIEQTDIPDIIERFHNRQKETDRKRSEQSFLVPYKEIQEQVYDLSINKYKDIEYDEIQYQSAEELIKKINLIEYEIQEGLHILEGLLNEKL
ncbi:MULTISPECIES: class I SAM-dependent DNA methyltransferase [unclassified Exiguobacterium]|uniref:type I restriction-modification system subunit M n=1 Tax=unclassified Exiguobacterium TaxID=2644629 RepID=UPI001038D497|nr:MULTISPECIES: class I SAM-dependent DNA methyltransferase [unclassified Exiguobacterium]TCI73593.1 SAM-dependent DNA methyltransferase [Exiguobacterium sp. IPCI3]TCI82750.1 SAM-dependent DNA methyltransferase [Exiguobacterium sp. IPCH1]TCI83804.1 SAM-dependent DNA methyltransferase [Exiguobacterium sp. IPBC4]